MQNRPSETLPDSPRPRRSELTCPGHDLAKMAKAAASGADEVILDLEDACAPNQKEAARAAVVTALRTLDFGKKIRAFRPNGPRTPLFYRDVIEVVEGAGAHLDCLVLPKAGGPEDVQFTDRLLTQIELAKGLPPGRIQIECLIESARGLLTAAEIARASPRMSSLIFGIADFAGDVGAPDFGGDSSVRFRYAKAQILVAARAAGIDAIDHVTVKYKDDDQCRRDAEGARDLGYDGKWAIHPSQVPILNQVFTPSPERVARAKAVVEAYEQAISTGRGAVGVGGEMIDAASLRVERRLLAFDPAANAGGAGGEKLEGKLD
jgi:citrate lyase subunit beta/citryl-CoA lyase